MRSQSPRIARLLGVRPGEGRLAARVALLFALIEAARGFGEIGVDTLVLSRLGAPTLPYLFVGLGITSLVVALAYGAALGRLARVPLFVGILLGVAALALVQRVALGGGATDVVSPLWLTIYAAGAIAVTICWTVAGGAFDARQAKRLFPLLTGAAIAGSFVGTLGSGPVASAAGTETLIVVEALLLVAAAALITRLPRREPGVGRGATARRRSILGELRAGFDFVARSPLMRLVAIAYVLFAILLFSVSYPFLLAASEAFADEAELARALGLFATAVTATSFIVSIATANRIYARFGVAGAGLLLPLVYLAGFGLWLVQFSFATAAMVRFAQQVSQRGVSNAAWSAFYNVMPGDRRAQVLAFMDGVPGQLGIVLSGILLLAAGRVLTIDQVFWLGAATALICTILVLAIRRRYAQSLLQALRTGLGEQVLEGGPGIGTLVRDPDVAGALIAALASPEPGVRRMAAAMLGRGARPDGREALLAALGDDDASVRAAAIDALRLLGPTSEERRRIAALLDDPVPGVRAASAIALSDDPADDRPAHVVERLIAAPTDPECVAGLDAAAWFATRLPSEAIDRRLDDPSASIRAAAIRAVAARRTGPGPRDAGSDEVLLDALDDDANVVRRAAAIALGSRPALSTALLGTLEHGSPRAQEAALRALAGHGPQVHDNIRAWAHRQIARAASLQAANLAVADGTPTTNQPLFELLISVLDRRVRGFEERAIAALAILTAPEAGALLRRTLRSRDPDERAQAIEALDSLGDRRLGRALTTLVEAGAAGAEPNGASRDAALRTLADDTDPWIRALADRIRRDGRAEMPETSRTLGDLDTMLALRRVPLFRDLEPEDLQRLAAAAMERWYPSGEALVREGELGDELVVLIEGGVRVVHADAEGGERLIRRYEAGDHIGELAVLRERPRAATVIAEGVGVRGLVLGGEGLKAILRERPEAAMAMLATLAERISSQ